MKLNLTATQVRMLLTKPEVYDNETKSLAMRGLVKLGLYRDSGDKRPLFVQTTQGDRVRNCLFELKDWALLSW